MFIEENKARALSDIETADVFFLGKFRKSISRGAKSYELIEPAKSIVHF